MSPRSIRPASFVIPTNTLFKHVSEEIQQVFEHHRFYPERAIDGLLLTLEQYKALSYCQNPLFSADTQEQLLILLEECAYMLLEAAQVDYKPLDRVEVSMVSSMVRGYVLIDQTLTAFNIDMSDPNTTLSLINNTARHDVLIEVSER